MNLLLRLRMCSANPAKSINSCQCVIIAIRPLIFSLLLERLDSHATGTNQRPLSHAVLTLARSCADSATKSLKILGQLREKNLLGVFYPVRLNGERERKEGDRANITSRNIPPLRSRIYIRIGVHAASGLYDCAHRKPQYFLS